MVQGVPLARSTIGIIYSFGTINSTTDVIWIGGDLCGNLMLDHVPKYFQGSGRESHNKLVDDIDVAVYNNIQEWPCSRGNGYDYITIQDLFGTTDGVIGYSLMYGCGVRVMNGNCGVASIYS